MSLDLSCLSTKLQKYRNNFLMSLEELSQKSGITVDRLNSFESGNLEPTGDEILIIADIYHCDYKYFISAETEPNFEKIEQLFRKHKNDLQVNDRWAIQECIYLAESEAFLDQKLDKDITQIIDFKYQKVGNYYKKHGYDAAIKLRELLNPSHRELELNIYNDFKKIGINIYRRKLENSSISGIALKHSSIGKFVLVNYNEDIFRQRFTVAHEAAHAIFDLDENDDFLSVSKWNKKDLTEIRADNFASTYLLPPFVLDSIPDNKFWSSDKLIEWAINLKVSVSALLIALKERNFINDVYYQTFRHVSIPAKYKIDPEFRNLSGKSLERKKYLIEKGITQTYINKCKLAYEKNLISASKMAELLLMDVYELFEINNLFQLGITYEN
jgi:Zn-dependent peptidase ImmA (M78 family)